MEEWPGQTGGPLGKRTVRVFQRKKSIGLPKMGGFHRGFPVQTGGVTFLDFSLVKFFTSAYYRLLAMANIFPRWTNSFPLQLVIALLFIGGGVTAGVTYYFTQKYTREGYQPNQPVPFSHVIHAKQLGMDCRYCHSFVEQSGHANVPTSSTCWNCHQHVKTNSPNLAAVKESVETGKPMEWVKVHKTPDYAYFNHSVHVSSGVSCVSCHGDITEMPVVYHKENQSMGWCLECHRNSETSLRPLDQITNLKYKPEDHGKTQSSIGQKIKENWKIDPPENCASCHR